MFPQIYVVNTTQEALLSLVQVCDSIVHHQLLSRYETLLKILYIYPKDEQIIRTFLSLTNEPLRDAKPPQTQRKKKKKQLNQGPSG